MRTNLAYEVIDQRQVPAPIAGIARVQSAPGGLRVDDIEGRTSILEYDDSDPDAFRDEEAAGIIEVRTVEGAVTFTSITKALWEDEFAPFWGAPALQTDEAVQEWVLEKLAEASR